MGTMKQRTLQGLIIAACDEAFSNHFKHLKPLQNNIEQMFELSTRITTIDESYKKSTTSYTLLGPVSEMHRALQAQHRKRMSGKLGQYHSQVKYLEFEFSPLHNPALGVRFRFSKLRRRHVQCTFMLHGDDSMFSTHDKFMICSRFTIGQYEEDGAVTVKLPWYLKALSWLVQKIAPGPVDLYKG